MANGKYQQLTCSENLNGNPKALYVLRSADQNSSVEIIERKTGATDIIATGSAAGPNGDFGNTNKMKTTIPDGSLPNGDIQEFAMEVKIACNKMGANFRSIKPPTP